jgi:hypothetical protein
MIKRTNRYRLTLEQLSLAKEKVALKPPLNWEFENHDEIFDIIDKVTEKNLFKENDESAEFALGLKLFSEVMVKNREHPLFEEFSPAFASFMKKLKNS